MAPKKSSSSAASASKQSSTAAANSSSSASSSSSSSTSTTLSSRSSAQDIAVHVWNQYLKNTPPRTKLLDSFMAFLVLVGGVQFLYCVLAGNYPFNAFLSGFSASVGQFVLTASLRMQTSSTTPNTPAISSTSSLISPATVTSATNKEKAGGEVIEDLGLGGKGYSPERAFADYVFGSLILHVFCVNFIN